MKKFVSIVLSCLMLVSVFCSLASAEETLVLDIFGKRLANTNNSLWKVKVDGGGQSVVNESTDVSTGEKYVSASFNQEGRIALESQNTWSGWSNLSSYRGLGYFLKLTMKVPEGKMPTGHVKVDLVDSNWLANEVTVLVEDQFVEGEWFDVYVPFDSFGSKNVNGGDFKFNDLKWVAITSQSDGPTEVWLKGMGLYNIPGTAQIKDISTQINTAGDYEVKIQFKGDVGEELIYNSAFNVGFMTAIPTYDAESAELTLVYEMVPDFPGEVLIRIDGDLTIFDNGVFSQDIVVTNNGIPEAVVFDTYSCTLEDNDITLTGTMRCIYDPVGDGEEVMVFIAVYSGDTLIDTEVSDSSVILNYKETNEVSLTVQDIDATEDIKAEIYIIDNETNGRPLAEVITINF